MSPSTRTLLREFVVTGRNLKSGSVWSSVVYVYDAQFVLCDYYKVGKFMMPSILKSVQILNVM